MDENETGYSSVWRKRLYAKERRHKNGLDYFPPYDWLGGWMSGKAVRGGEVVAFGTVQWRPNEEAP